MNLFDKLVNEALQNQPNLTPLRIVVEKELLHHDILRVMRDNKLMTGLTFIGGTCLRSCYGAIRLSEDLDFTGGSNFTRENLSSMGKILTQSLQEKYDLQVTVSEPIMDKLDVDTWKIKVETKPGSKHLPAQCIHIDICSVPSYEKHPIMLINPYGVEMGTSGLIIKAQSREEIYTDKLIAFAFSPNRIKYRDLWDIIWLHGQGLKPRLELIPKKLSDRHDSIDNFFKLFQERLALLKNSSEMANEFMKEMRRFLPAEQIKKTLEQEDLWGGITYLIDDLGNKIFENQIDK